MSFEDTPDALAFEVLPNLAEWLVKTYVLISGKSSTSEIHLEIV